MSGAQAPGDGRCVAVSGDRERRAAEGLARPRPGPAWAGRRLPRCPCPRGPQESGMRHCVWQANSRDVEPSRRRCSRSRGSAVQAVWHSEEEPGRSPGNRILGSRGWGLQCPGWGGVSQELQGTPPPVDVPGPWGGGGVAGSQGTGVQRRAGVTGFVTQGTGGDREGYLRL